MLAKRKAIELEDEQAPLDAISNFNYGHYLPASPFLQTCSRETSLFKTNKRQRTFPPTSLHTPDLYNGMNNQSPIQSDMFNTESSYLPLPTDDNVLKSYTPFPSSSSTDSAYTPLNQFNKREMSDTPSHWKEPVRKRQRTEVHDHIDSDAMNAMLLNGGFQGQPIALQSFTPAAVTERPDVGLATKLKNGEAISVKLCCGLEVESVSEKMLSMSLTNRARSLSTIPLSIAGNGGNEYALAVVPYIPREQHVQNILESTKKKQETQVMKEEEEEQEDEMRMDIDYNAGKVPVREYGFYGNID